MKRNRIKIVSNGSKNSFSYFFQNEKGEWNLVTDSSPLSRDDYTALSIRENANEILQVINDTYNPGNRGVDIYFEGAEKDFDALCKAVADKFFGSISCYYNRRILSIAVGGKQGVGKTTLISELISKRECNMQTTQNEYYVEYDELESETTWYEIEGIDFDNEDIQEHEKHFKTMVNDGINNFIYCIHGNRIDPFEVHFIKYVQDKCPEVRVIIALTKCVVYDTDDIDDEIKQCIGEVKIIPVLARDSKVRNGVISAYGIDEIIDYIFNDVDGK